MQGSVLLLTQTVQSMNLFQLQGQLNMQTLCKGRGVAIIEMDSNIDVLCVTLIKFCLPTVFLRALILADDLKQLLLGHSHQGP